MKNLIIYSCASLLAFTSCNDVKFSSQYDDPSKTQNVSCPGLMLGVWQAANTWMNPVYYRYYVSSTTSGLFSGVIGHTNSKDRFSGTGQGYFNERWKNFFNTLTQFRALEAKYLELTEEEQKDNYIFLLLGRTVMHEQLYEVCSLWGGVPYTEAGTLWATGNVVSSKPKYDSDIKIYRTILHDLNEVNTYLSEHTLSSNSSTFLQAKDYVNNGDISLWRKYVNSLRLRIAIHISSNGELMAEGQAAIKSMLENPETYPMVDTNGENITVQQTDDNQFNFDRDLQNSIENSRYNRMSGFMQRALNANTNNQDPRLEVLYDSNWDNEYIGLDPTETNTQQEQNLNITTHGAAKYYAALDTSTFTRNPGFPGLWMTASEVYFMKAEAYTNKWANGDAKEAFVKGIELSTEFYYNLNATGAYRTPLTLPSREAIITYANSQWNSENPLKEILTQRWIHHGAIQQLEAWNIVRRTGYPELYFKKDPQSLGTPLPLDRLMYPSDEKDYNTENLNAYMNGVEDTWYKPLNWMKDKWYKLVE